MVSSCKGDVAQTKQDKARRTQVVPLDFGIERVQQANCFPVPTTPGTAALRVNIWSPIGKPESPSTPVHRCKNPLPPVQDDSEFHRRQLVHLTGVCARCEANV